MKIALLAVGKNEEQHLLEFIEHYKNISIDTIFFGDNDDEGTKQYDLLKSYIDLGFVKYYNYHGVKNIQHKFYDDIYFQEKDNYDWFAVFDCDEFLCLDNFNNIKDYINDCININEYFDLIQVRWKFGKYKELTYYNQNKSYKKDEDEGNFEFCYSNSIKSIFRSSDKIARISPHYPVYKESNIISYVEGIGNIDFIQYHQYNFDNISNIYLKHYIWKSLDEYFDKIIKGRASRTETWLELKPIDSLINTYFNQTHYIDVDNKAYEYLINKFQEFLKTKENINNEHINENH